MRLVIPFILLTLSLSACKKSSEQPPQPASATSAAPAPVSPPAHPQTSVPATVNEAALLTDEKVKGMVTYTKILSGGADGLMHAAVGAHARAGGDPRKAAGEMLKSEGMNKLADVGSRALAQSGLTQQELSMLMKVLAPYFTRRKMAADASKALAEIKAKGKPSVMENFYKQQVEKGEKVRQEFAGTYGKDALAIVDRHEQDYFAAQAAMLKAAFKKR
jgi:hypothetical protein